MKKYYKIIKSFGIAITLLVSSCAVHHPPARHYTVASFKSLQPSYVTTEDGRVEYYQFGHGTPVVFIPGYATDVSSWNRDLLAVVARQHQVILINNRNVAGSLSRSASYQCSDLADDTYLLIKKLNLNRPAIVGISMGGMIAQAVALKHPESIGQLILINTSIAGRRAVHPHPRVEKKLKSLPKNKIGFYASAVDLFFPPQYKMQMAYSLAANRFLPKQRTDINAARVMPQQLRLVMGWLDNDAAASKLEKLHLPVLVMNGEADIVIPPKNSEILANTIPGARLVRWKDGGHAMIYQYPLEIGDEINRFIGS